MTTMKEDFCSFEISKLLEEEGFDWPCNSYYISLDAHKCNVTDFARPTHQMAMKWLREIKDIDIVILPLWDKDGKSYYYEIHSDDVDVRKGRFAKFEQAVEAALENVLKNLESLKNLI